MKSSLQPFFYIGLILFGIFSAIFFVDDPVVILAELPEIKTFLILSLLCSFFGLLFWKITKQLIFSSETGKITLKILRFKIPLYSKTFWIKDCIKFDIQFIPRWNASYLVLHHNGKKQTSLQMKKKEDDVHTHLNALNTILSSIKSDNYPSALKEIKKFAIDEKSSAFDQKRNIIRDVDNNIVMSTKFFKFVLVIFPFLVFAFSYTNYLITKSDPLNEDFLLSFFFNNLWMALFFMWIIYLLFLGIRVKDPHVENQNEILSGSPIFKSPKFLQKILSSIKVTYIEPEQKNLYIKFRLGFMILGFIPAVLSFVFYLFYQL